jgi:hypothetical protein
MKPHRSDITYYRGGPCSTCGATLRYRISRNCVECSRATALLRYYDARDRRREADAAEHEQDIDAA